MINKLALQPFALAAGLAFTAGAFAAPWTVVPETSSVAFVGTQQGTKFNGRFQTFTATIDLDAADPTKGSIVGTVQLDSVNTRDHDRDASLLDKDWFNAKEFPQAKFESQKIEKAADGSYVANGQLTLKGQTKPIAMKFTLTGSGAATQFAGTMSINRFDFNVGEGWNDTSWVAQDVAVEVKLDLKR
ncbi:MAG TPA: YceI family protein [Gammaproteobacteria bacterium]